MSEPIADFFWHNHASLACVVVSDFCKYCEMWAEELINKLCPYLALLATLNYVQKIISIIIVDTALKTPATHLLTPTYKIGNK